MSTYASRNAELSAELRALEESLQSERQQFYNEKVAELRISNTSREHNAELRASLARSEENTQEKTTEMWQMRDELTSELRSAHSYSYSYSSASWRSLGSAPSLNGRTARPGPAGETAEPEENGEVACARI